MGGKRRVVFFFGGGGGGLGSNGETSLRRMVVRKLGQATERSSCWIWLKRDKSSWKPTPNTQSD